MDKTPIASAAPSPKTRRARVAKVENGPLPAQGHGRVQVAGTEHYVVDAAGRRLRARRAASCLLQPEAGDEVAWCGGDAGTCYIYAVLVRAGEGEQQWVMDGNATLRTRNGSLNLHADEAVDLQAPRIATTSEILDVRSTRAAAVFDTLDAVSRACSHTVAQLRLVGTQISSVFDRVFQHAKNHHRVVDGMDTVQVTTADWKAEGLMSLHAENVLTNGERLVKTRGTQIHLG